MVTVITQDLLTSTINRPRTKCYVRKGIVIHYTGNFGKKATARANRNYFNNTTTYASTHFLVDDKEIIQAIPLNEAAWSVGAKSYTSIGKKLFHNGLQPNYTTVSIEMCVNSDSEYNKVEENTVWLVVYLMKKYNLGIQDIYRHYDITGKSCPLFYLTDKDWNNFLAKVKDAYNDTKRGESIVLDQSVDKVIKLTQVMNVRKGPNQSYDVIQTLQPGTELNVFDQIKDWYKVKIGNTFGFMSANSKYSKDVSLGITDDINISNSPSLNITGASGKITADILNIRKEPSTSSTILGTYKNGETIQLLEEKAGWYRTNKGWIYGQYVERIDERFNSVLTADANIRDVNLNIICTGVKGDKILTSNKREIIKGFPVYACKYKDKRGYIQESSFKGL